ncbi:MAG: diacylglycerol kinase family protein [Bacteroidota bacterium]
MKQRIFFIINPISGVGRKKSLPRIIENKLDHTQYEYEIAYTEYKKHAGILAKQASEQGFDIVCAVGGDGSVHEVGTALIGTATKLAIIPTGSGNGLARHLGIPKRKSKAIQFINKQESVQMDTVLVNDESFLGVAGWGFDAHIAKRFEEHRKRGLITYARLVVREFFKYNPLNITIDMNGEVKQMPLMLCTIANSSQFGNGFCVSPKSSITDGILEMVLMKPFKIWNAPRVVMRSFRKKSDRLKNAEIIQFQSATIEIPGHLGHFDGESVCVSSFLKIEVNPHSLNILVGKNKL